MQFYVDHSTNFQCVVLYTTLLNIAAILIGIVAFVFVAMRYQYWERDEPDNIYHYAEEYYANAQDEPDYDCDDYDNLNVQTID